MEDPSLFREKLDRTLTDVRAERERRQRLAARLSSLVTSGKEFDERNARELIDLIEKRAMEAAESGETTTEIGHSTDRLYEAEDFRACAEIARQFFEGHLTISIPYVYDKPASGSGPMYSNASHSTTVSISFGQEETSQAEASSGSQIRTAS